ncbi:sarcospan-like [Gigantopelta aegis]|uniref:sarcospan-like n=1 Tax=Gigantopelta aegis TaxID=1735272 RepID=UPI001B88E6CD|nr:sarcospan-like [Gigantopelta aegis]
MVISGRPRAHSASSIKFTSVLQPSHLKKGASSYSSPELRSMLVELETTVPLSIIPSHLGSSHGFKHGRRTMGGGCCDCRCCRIHILLVTLQVLLGVAITAMSLYLQLYIPVARVRDTPYWAGIPLCLAGVAGIYYCATDFRSYTSTSKAFAIKATCFILSFIAIFLMIIATTFPAIHLGRIFTFQTCTESANHCICYMSQDQTSRAFTYFDTKYCRLILEELKLYLIIIGSMCFLSSLASIWLVVLLWQSRYGQVYSGSKRQFSLRAYPENRI